MAKRIPCSDCGVLRWRSAGKSEIICQSCRRIRVTVNHGLTGYKAGCRCDICREGNRLEQLAYRRARKGSTGLAQKRRASRDYRSPSVACVACGELVPNKTSSNRPMHNACRPPRFWANAIQISHRGRMEIYFRDLWVCQICSEPVDPSLTPQHRMAATLDHIAPRALTLFPDDTPGNLRLAHRACNSRRGISAA